MGDIWSNVNKTRECLEKMRRCRERGKGCKQLKGNPETTWRWAGYKEQRRAKEQRREAKEQRFLFTRRDPQ